MTVDRNENKLPYRPCVGIMLFNHENQVWTGRRIPTRNVKNTDFLWQMPQGGIDDGEQPFEAAMRELGEEIGTNKASLIAEHPQWLNYDLPKQLGVNVFRGKYGGQTQKWFAMRFEGKDEDIDISGGTEHKAEFDAWRWQNISMLPKLVVSFKREVYQAVVNEFEIIVR